MAKIIGRITVHDLFRNLDIDGDIIVKQYNEETQGYNILGEGDDTTLFNPEVREMEVKFIYAKKDALVIEV